MTDIKTKYSIRVDEVDNSCKTVIIVYGFSEYIDKYNGIAEILGNNGFRVVRYELRGHGNSEKGSGDVESFFNMVDDLDEVVDYTHRCYPDEEIFTLGYSMGGLISMLYGITYGAKDIIKGQILIAPETDIPVKGIKTNLLNLISYMTPKIKISNPMYQATDNVLNTNTLNKMTLRFAREMFIKAPQYLKDNLSKYSTPCLFIHGSNDRWADIQYSRNALEGITSRDKELIELPMKGHGLLKDSEAVAVLKSVVDWVERR